MKSPKKMKVADPGRRLLLGAGRKIKIVVITDYNGELTVVYYSITICGAVDLVTELIILWFRPNATIFRYDAVIV